MLLRSCKAQSFGLLSFASSTLPALPGTKPRKQIQVIAPAWYYWLLLIALQHMAITPTALDATTAPDYSVLFYELRYQLRPTRILVQVPTCMAPPSLLPASAANEQGTGTGVSNYCAIKELACSRFEQLPRMRLTTRDAPFLRSLSPDLPLAIEISIADDTELMSTSNEGARASSAMLNNTT